MSIFYQKLTALCEKHNIKPTPLMRKLELSATNLKRWENGSTVNSDILLKIADYFDVTVDYLINNKLVLCSECEHYVFDKFGSGRCEKYNVAFPENGFCSYGVRRENIYEKEHNLW